MTGKIFLYFILGLTVSTCLISPAKAQNKLGEIININYKYKIAFTDLTQNDVQTGDKVAVKGIDGTTVYLEAVEVYPVMVKLSIAATPGYALSDDQFARIVVGSHVNVVDQEMFKSPLAISQQSVPDAPPSGAAKQNSVRNNFSGKVSATLSDTAEAKQPDRKRPTAGGMMAPDTMKVYDPNKITTRVETVSSPGETAPSPVVPEAPAPAVAQESRHSNNMEYKVTMLEQKVDKLVDTNLSMAEQITKFLKQREAFEELLKEKDTALTIARNQILNMTITSKPNDQELKDLQKQLAKLKEEKSAADKEIVDLNKKLAQLKKKLARTVELLNKHMKAYE